MKDRTCKKIKEDAGAAPVNSAGSGNIAGIGVGKQGEPGINPKKRKLTPFMGFVRRKVPPA